SRIELEWPQFRAIPGFAQDCPLRHPESLISLDSLSLHDSRNTPEFPPFCGGGSGAVVRRDALLTSAAGETRRVSLFAIAAVPFNSAGTPSQPASAEAENAALFRPSERQAGMSEQLLCGEVARMP